MEVVGDDEDIDVEYSDSPQVAMIDDNDEVILDTDPVLTYPYMNSNESVNGTLRRLRNCFENGMLSSDYSVVLIKAKTSQNIWRPKIYFID